MGLKLCIYLLFYMIYLGQADRLEADYCESRVSCSECIKTANCAWCEKVNSTSRCFHRILRSEILSQCEGFIQDKQSKKNVLEEKPFNSISTEVVQITPQKIKIDLRVGESVEFNFKYMQAKNYPVDLYFLLDASATMEKVRHTIVQQSKQIIETMGNFTDKISLGFGTFVDKNTLPYVSNPASGAYSFRHEMRLEKLSQDNVTRFTGLIAKVDSIGNYDTPEGGLDGLAQVLACEKVIGWSPHSRKIILFITDAPYHAAGDGIIAGIHQPYDGKCHTTKEGKYMKELEMDYPSVAMIYKLAKEQEAIIIFTVEESVKMIYKDLAGYIGGKVTSFKKDQNKNKKENSFHEILKEVYQDKTNFIKLKKSFIPNSKALNIIFDPDCSIENLKSPDACAVIEQTEISIKGTITLSQYVNVNKYTVNITVDGLNEQLQLEVNVIKNCDCEDNSKKTPNASDCSSNGTLVCGLCECNKDWFGPKCRCTKDGTDKDTSSCVNSNDNLVCSGYGNCVCGTCECYKQGDQKLYCGSFCQIKVNDCPIGANGKLCSGSNHGKCDCGVCHCHQDWDGLACDTSKLKKNCLRDNKMCNERGKCINNTCVCKPAPEWDARQNTNKWCGYDGKPKTDDLKRQCSLLEENARCAYKKDSCFDLGTRNSVIAHLEENIDEVDRKVWTICEDTRVSPGCYIKFAFKYDDENRKIQLLVAKNADCLENYYRAGGGTFAALIIGGICALVGWKIVTTRRDRREYEQFLLSTKQRTSSVRTNVLYTSPTRTINNPAYVGNKKE